MILSYFAFLLLAGTGETSSHLSHEDIFAALAAYNAAECKKITSYVVEMESHATVIHRPIAVLNAPARGFKVFSTTKLWRRGELYAVETHRKTEDDDGKVIQEIQKAVLNNAYMAFSPMPGRVEQHLHASCAELSKREVDLKGIVFAPDPVKLGYETSGSSLESVLQNAREFKSKGLRWEFRERADREGGGYLAQRFLPAAFGGTKPDAEMVIEPNRGYMVTRIRGYDWNDGRTEGSCDVEPQRLENGIWFPKKIVETTGTGPDMSRTITVTSAAVNCPLPDRTFELSALGLDEEGVQLRRYSADGTATLYVRYQNEWIPDAVVPEDLKN